MAKASSEAADKAKGPNALIEVTGAGEFAFQTTGKLRFEAELLRMVSVEPAVEVTLERSRRIVALRAVTTFSKCVDWAVAGVDNKNTKDAVREAVLKSNLTSSRTQAPP